MIIGLVILLFKIKYLAIAQFYISRFNQVVYDVWKLVLIIFFIEITFAYAYKVIYLIDQT